MATNPGPAKETTKTPERLPKEVFMHFLPQLADAFSECPESVANELVSKKLIARPTWEEAQMESVAPHKKANNLLYATQTAFSQDGDKNLRKLCKIMSKFAKMKRLSAKIMNKYQRALSHDGELSSSSDSESSESDSDSGSLARITKKPEADSSGNGEKQEAPSYLDCEPPDEDLYRLVATKIVDHVGLGVVLHLKMHQVEMIKRMEYSASNINMKILATWKEQQSRTPTTWFTLIKALREMERNKLAGELEEGLKR